MNKGIIGACVAAIVWLVPVVSHAAPLYRLAASIPLGGGVTWDYLQFDGRSGDLFIAHGPEVTVVDTKSGKVIGALANLPGSHGIAVAPDTGLIYADSADRGVVVAFDPHTFASVASVPVLAGADGINYDPVTKMMYVSGGDGNGLTVVSTVTNQKVATIDLRTAPEFHVADGEGGEYVDLVDANEIARIDTATNKVTARWPTVPCQHPKGLAIDPVTHRLFASCANGIAVVMNAETGTIMAALPIGQGTDAAVFDLITKRFISSNGDGTLTIVQETAADKFAVRATVPTARGARTMAIDPATGRLFLVTAVVAKTTPPTTPGGRPHYEFVPGSLKLLVYDRAS